MERTSSVMGMMEAAQDIPGLSLEDVEEEVAELLAMDAGENQEVSGAQESLRELWEELTCTPRRNAEIAKRKRNRNKSPRY